MPDREANLKGYQNLEKEAEMAHEELREQLNPFRKIMEDHGYVWGRDHLMIPRSLWGGMRRFFIQLKERARRRDQPHPFPDTTLEEWMEETDYVCRVPDGILDIDQPHLLFTTPSHELEWSESI